MSESNQEYVTAINWWDSLHKITQYEFAESYFPTFTFIEVHRDSTLLLEIYLEEHK
jgi:hypothetical protein